MVKCPHCGEENRDDLKFCRMCGKNIQDPPKMIKCPHCGVKNPWESTFCNSCGKNIHKKGFPKKLVLGVIIIVIIVAAVILFSGVMSPNQSSINLNGDNSVNEHVSSQNEEVKLKKVDFNRLFNMYVPSEYNYYEYPSPQYNSTYQWSTNGASADIYYYNHSHNLNGISSRLNEAYPGLQESIEGNLIILSSNSGKYFVGVQSQGKGFVFITGNDLDTLKTCADSIVFE